ncbi:MAG: ABC transporter substrate-binding protein [Dehalococcoidia bacterium]
MKSRMTFAALMAVLLLAAVACAGSTPEGGDGAGGEGEGEGGGEMVWAIGGAEAQPGALHTQIAELWGETHSDMPPVRIETLPEAADEQRQQQALVLNGQDPSFDLIAMDVIWTGEYSTNGWLESMEDRRGDLEGVLAGPMESAAWEGELWAAPLNTNAGFFYYRTDLMDAAPRTWDEATQMCTAAAEEEGISAYVAQGAQYEGMIVNYLEYFFGGGGEMFNEDSTEVLFGEGEAAVRALEFMQESVDNGFYANGFNTLMENESQAEFLSGQAACMRNWPSFYTLLEDEEAGSEVKGKFDIAPIPTFSGEGASAVTGGFNTAVSAFSENKEAAKEFAVWAATDPEVQTMYGQGNLPPVLEATYEELSDDKVMATLAEILPSAKPRPPSPEWANISIEMQEQLFPAYNEGGDAQATVDSITEFLQGTIEE